MDRSGLLHTPATLLLDKQSQYPLKMRLGRPMLCRLVGLYRYFREMCCLHDQARKISGTDIRLRTSALKKPTERKIMAKEHVTHVIAIIQLTETKEREKVWL
jgi:hypothetical protein